MMQKYDEKASPRKIFSELAFLFSENRILLSVSTHHLSCYTRFFQQLAALFQEVVKLADGLGTQHLDAHLAEIGNTLEDGRGCQVAAGMENGTQFVARIIFPAFLNYMGQIDLELFFQDINFIIKRQYSPPYGGGAGGEALFLLCVYKIDNGVVLDSGFVLSDVL